MQVPHEILAGFFENDKPSEGSDAEEIKHQNEELIEEAELELLGDGIFKVTDFPKRNVIHPNEYWEATRVKTVDLIQGPEDIRRKLKNAYELGIQFEWFILLDQHITPPKVRYIKEKREKFRFDPILIGLIKCEEDKGIPYLIGIWDHE
jgi:hypothetical protein